MQLPCTTARPLERAGICLKGAKGGRNRKYLASAPYSRIATPAVMFCNRQSRHPCRVRAVPVAYWCYLPMWRRVTFGANNSFLLYRHALNSKPNHVNAVQSQSLSTKSMIAMAFNASCLGEILDGFHCAGICAKAHNVPPL